VRLSSVLGPTVVFLGALAIWEAATSYGWVDGLVLPSPLAVVSLFAADPGLLASNAGVTAAEAMSGLFIGNCLGLLLAILFVNSPTSRRSVLPLAMGAQSIPIVAVTPALIIGFGNGMEPKILIAAFLVFFPMLVNAMRGLRSADAEVGELMHTLSANGFQRLWMIRLPAALPFIFTALKFSACSCHRRGMGGLGPWSRSLDRAGELAVSRRRGVGGGAHLHRVQHGNGRARRRH